jgi:hypothetical protein
MNRLLLPTVVLGLTAVLLLPGVVAADARANATADLGVNFITVELPAHQTVGRPFSLRVGIVNSGPDTSFFRVQLVLPDGVRTTGPGSLECTGTGVLNCAGDNAPPGYDANASVPVVADAPGSYTVTARLIELTAADPNPTNNEASLTLTVVASQVLAASTPRIVPARPRAGATFNVSFGVQDKTSETFVTPSAARCTASPGRTKARVSNARAVCTVTTAASARGRTVRGVVTAVIGSRRFAKPFNVRLR